MFLLLLAIIYLAFIGLGLPASLLGSAWPSMYSQLEVPLAYAGLVSILITIGTVVSSLWADRLGRRFNIAPIITVSMLISAASMFGFATADRFWLLCLYAIPLGLATGVIDASLNNYVALHYSSKAMNWLHCFWAVGASISPYIMGFALTRGTGWSQGYLIVSLLLMGVTAILLASFPLWRKHKAIVANDSSSEITSSLRLLQLIKLPGVKMAMLAFIAYCGLEMTAALWASSYLVSHRNIHPDIAARYGALFFIGVMAGRFFSGFISDRLGDRKIIRLGISIILIGILAVFLPLPVDWMVLGGLIIIGLGCAPIFPALIHATPVNFGKEHSQAVIGVQMASAYTGATFLPPLFGFIAGFTGIAILPVVLLFWAVVMMVAVGRLNRLVDVS